MIGDALCTEVQHFLPGWQQQQGYHQQIPLGYTVAFEAPFVEISRKMFCCREMGYLGYLFCDGFDFGRVELLVLRRLGDVTR